MRKKLQKWGLAVMAVFSMIGAILGITLVYIFRGHFNISALLGAFAGTMILIMINIIKVSLKKNTLPEVDERTVKNISTFFLYSSHIFLLLLLIALTIITLMGGDSIQIIHLWIGIFAYLWISGIGALIVYRR